jgi:hypothetical protein
MAISPISLHVPTSSTASPASFRAALENRVASGSATAVAPEGARPGGATSPPLESTAAHPAQAALEAVERARLRLDSVLEAARRGQTFTAQELLALQADAYRYSQTLDVASKVVEQGVQSVKQAVNTQV